MSNNSSYKLQVINTKYKIQVINKVARCKVQDKKIGCKMQGARCELSKEIKYKIQRKKQVTSFLKI